MNVEEYSTKTIRIRPSKSRTSQLRRGAWDVENPPSAKHKVDFGGVSMISPSNKNALAECNRHPARPRDVQDSEDAITTKDVGPFSTFSGTSLGTHDDAAGPVRKVATVIGAPPPAQTSPALSPGVRSCSDSVFCDDIDLDQMPLRDGEWDQGSLAWNNNKPFTETESELSNGEDNSKDDIYAARKSDNVENETSSVAQSASDNFTSQEAGYYSGSEYAAGIRQITPLNPIDEVRRNVAALDDGDAVFNVQLDLVMDKLVYALMDLDSAYLFRDFAGHFTEFLDRFGPGGYDSHRAPASANWMLSLMLPMIHADADASDTHVRVYSEVSGWLQRMVRVLGWRNADALLEGGPWERCIEHMSSSRLEVAKTALETAEVILRNVPLEYGLILKVVLIQPLDINLNDTDLCRFRLYRVKLLSALVERIDDACRAGKGEQYKSLVPEIVRALEKLKSEEVDLRVTKSIDICLKYAFDTEALLVHTPADQLSPRTRRPHLSLTFSKWQQQQLALQQESTAKQKPWFLRRLFHRQSKEGDRVKTTGYDTPDARDVMSIRTSKSTRTLRQRWKRFFKVPGSGPGSTGEEDAHTVITI